MLQTEIELLVHLHKSHFLLVQYLHVIPILKDQESETNTELDSPCSSHVSSLIPRGSGGSGARTRLDGRRPVGRDGGTGGELPTGGWGAGKEGTPGPSCNTHISIKDFTIRNSVFIQHDKTTSKFFYSFTWIKSNFSKIKIFYHHKN